VTEFKAILKLELLAITNGDFQSLSMTFVTLSEIFIRASTNPASMAAVSSVWFIVGKGSPSPTSLIVFMFAPRYAVSSCGNM
jgi:hypothetical protein